MKHRDDILLLPQNRVWRTYPGGATLDRLAGVAQPRDSHFAEDWIASVTASNVPGRQHLREGVSQVVAGGQTLDLKQLIETDAEYFLGPKHLEKFGPHPVLLVKFLDSAIRLHLQAHPSQAFARDRLASPSGKTEAYYVMAVRDNEPEPFVYMGFQHPPTRDELRSMIERQDVAAMERCFEKIPLKPGDTLLIPGGFPHALGGGVFMIEIQEPTDFVVRYEFERNGYVLPEGARFMGRDLDFGLSMIDFSERPMAEIDERWRCKPRHLRDLGAGSWQEDLIGPGQTSCFRVRRSHINAPVEKHEGEFHIVIATKGSFVVSTKAGRHRIAQFEKFLVPAGLGPVRIEPETPTEIIECYPPI